LSVAEYSDLPLSLSPEYCKNWTRERAISELVANAIDESRPFTFKWTDGVLVIEDEANGLPRSSLVLGLSGKTDKQIGQFGEGLDIACLVLARTNTPMQVETVGYSFTPLIQHDKNLETEVLHIRFVAGDPKRTKGTKISITCPKDLADKVKSRFRHLSVPGYKGPKGIGEVIKEGKGGRVYIGGVLVQENTGLLLSYDLATESAKKLQNRDRSVIDARERRTLIHDIAKNIEDPEIIERVVLGAQEGKGEPEEMSFANNVTPKQRKALADIRKKLFGDVRIAVLETYNQEANLILKDYQYTLVGGDKDNRLNYMVQRLYQAMGIPMAAEAARDHATVRRDGKPKTKREITKETTWTKDKSITPEERGNLDWAIALARGLFGVQVVGDVKIYDSRRIDADGEDLDHGGYYDQKGAGFIALKHSLLGSRQETFGTLGHEIGHRKRHRTGHHDYQDRTRGFESELTDMIGALGEVVSKAGIDPATLRPDPGVDTIYPGRLSRVPKGVVTPGTMVVSMLREAMEQAGYTSQRSLAEAVYVKPAPLARLFKPELGPPEYPDIEAVCEALGITPAVVGLAKFVDHFHYYRKQSMERKRKIFPAGTNRRKIESLLAKLSEHPAYATQAGEIQALMTGPFEQLDKADLSKPFVAMLAIEQERLAQQKAAVGREFDL
jgi:hypothetical protein